MSLAKVQTALLTEFLAAFPSMPVAWENVPFSPAAGQTFFSYRFQTSDERPGTLGTDGADIVVGIIQIEVYIQKGKGESNLAEMIGALRACFRPGSLIYSGQSVAITNRSRGGSYETADHYVTPFSVTWSAHIKRN